MNSIKNLWLESLSLYFFNMRTVSFVLYTELRMTGYMHKWLNAYLVQCQRLCKHVCKWKVCKADATRAER